MTFFSPLRSQRIRLGVIALASVAILGTTGVVVAWAQDTPGAQQDMHREHGPGRAMEWFKTKLKLNPSQAALWDQAAEKMRPPAGMREKKRAEHERYLAALMDPSFDPRKWIADQDRERAEQEAHMKESRTAWLAVWDSLDAGQRTQVREFLFKRAQHHGHHFGGHDHGDRGGMRPGDGGPGKMDSAPMPKQ